MGADVTGSLTWQGRPERQRLSVVRIETFTTSFKFYLERFVGFYSGIQVIGDSPAGPGRPEANWRWGRQAQGKCSTSLSHCTVARRQARVNSLDSEIRP